MALELDVVQPIVPTPTCVDAVHICPTTYDSICRAGKVCDRICGMCLQAAPGQKRSIPKGLKICCMLLLVLAVSFGVVAVVTAVTGEAPGTSSRCDRVGSHVFRRLLPSHTFQLIPDLIVMFVACTAVVALGRELRGVGTWTFGCHTV